MLKPQLTAFLQPLNGLELQTPACATDHGARGVPEYTTCILGIVVFLGLHDLPSGQSLPQP